MMIIFFKLLLILLPKDLHPFHVSVCDVEFNREAKAIQVSQRIFVNDFEQALNKKFNLNLVIDDTATASLRDSLISVYLQDNLTIYADGKQKEPDFLGTEFEEDGIWCYIEFDGVKRAQTIVVESTILLDLFDDQANIVHFKVGEYEKSVKLDKKVKSRSFEIPKS